MSHSSTTNNALQMSDLSNRQEFEKSQRDMARMQQFGKVMESKAISDGQRNKYTSKLKELRTFLHNFEEIGEETGARGDVTYKKTRPYQKFVSEKAQYAFGIKGKRLAKHPEIVELFLLSLKPCKRGKRADRPLPQSDLANGQQQQESEEWVGKGVPMLKQYRAAISHLFSVQDVEPSNKYSNHMKKFFKGLGNDAAAKGKRRKAKESGKDALPYPLYIDIMQKYGAMGKCMFVAFLGMTWNLICRGKQTANIYLSQLRVDNDAMTVSYESTKTDSEGRTITTLEPRHLYANPFNWKCCVFTWLGIYFLTESNLHVSNLDADGDGLLFPGRYSRAPSTCSCDSAHLCRRDKKTGEPNQKDTFAKGLKRDKDKKGCLNSTFQRHGCDPNDSGVHSVRKGAATIVASASTAGPSMPAICNRCNWSIGTVLDRYLRYEGAGDQFVGRTVALMGLLSSWKFMVLPPHFVCDVSADVLRLFPIISSVPTLLPVLSLCLASVVYHYKCGHLRELPDDHVL
jgi:hypothetical protein